MNYRRAVLFGVFLWATSVALYTLTTLAPIVSVGGDVKRSLVYWIFLIPLTLGLAKWYFRKSEATFTGGLALGVFSLVISFVLDLLTFIPAFMQSASEAYGTLLSLYTSWQFLVSSLLIVGLTSFAGFEFDTTYAEPMIKGQGKEIKK